MRRLIWLLVVAACASAVGIAAHATHVLRRPELASVDARFDVRGRQAPPKDVALIGIDAQTVNEIRRQRLPRRYHARVITRLRRAGARAVAYDLEFTAPTDARNDNALIDALRRSPGIVLATTSVNEDSTGAPTPVLGGGETLAYSRAIPALANTPPRAGRYGVIRRVVAEEQGLRTFPVAAAERALGHRIDRSRLAGDGAWIDFPGAAGTITAIPFVDVLRGKVPDARFRGKVVVVGATAPILQDVHAVSTGPGMPGPEINAAAIQTILDDFPLRDAPGWAAVLVILAAGTLTPLAAIRLTGLRWLPVPLLLAVLGVVGAQVAFDAGRIVPVAAPAVALLVSGLGTLAVAYATDLRERRRLRAAFARFVPASVVDDVVAQAGDDLRLGGERREGTVMFSDLRGFTSIAEQLAPEQVITLLNRYLTEMSDAILDHGGTVVSYMGDGIMAVFGAPLPQPDHADRALAAAREMLGPRLAAFGAWARDEGIEPEMRIGIGVCTGPVMSGNVGSQRRLEYTAVGDTTNTASRLEAMTKDAGCAVLISDATRDALRGDADGLREVGELPVRGRTAPLRCWTFSDS